MSFVRTVTGDIDPGELGVTYAHEHLVIDPGPVTAVAPDFDLSDVDRMVPELETAYAAGLRTAVDAMPCTTGRNASKLAELSRRSGVRIIAPTGLHHARFYGEDDLAVRVLEEQLVDLFATDIESGIDANDYRSSIIERTPYRAGVIKIAGSRDHLSDRDGRVFRAAAAAHARTGAPILTHCDAGTAGVEQVELLTANGVEPGHIALSHVDKVVDRGYHQDLVRTGAFVEYDGSFRWGHEPNGTLQLLVWLAEDDALDQVLLGMDAARQGYYTVYGGTPGLSWLLDGFTRLMDEAGIGAADRHRLFVDNPARAFAFRAMDGGTE
jgi:phosphotriesterase-related protein